VNNPLTFLVFRHYRTSQMSVNICLEHFHAFHREQVGVKRTFVVTEDPDCPQDATAPVDRICYGDYEEDQNI
jgi:hypothetical protein